MTTKTSNKAVLAGLAAGLLAGSGVALVATLPGGAGASTAQVAPAVADDADESTDATESAADREPGEWLTEALQPLVDDGTLTAAQVEAVIAALDEARPDHGPGMGHGGPGRGVFIGAGIDTVADTLGITEDELRTQLQEDDATIASVAEANGSSAQAVIDALVAEAEAHLTEEVADGDLTQAEADERLADATQHLTDMVNGELPSFPGGRPGHGPWGG